MLRETMSNQDKEWEKRKRIFILLVIFCVICIIITVIVQIVELTKPTDIKKIQEDTLEEVQIIEFDKLFDDKISIQEDKVDSLYKKDKNKETVYTIYEKNEKLEKKYDLSINIPTINLSSKKIDEINKEIINTFKAKADNIIQDDKEEEIIYTVEYSTYINSNILSIVIKSTLKEGRNAQRVIVKGYTYNIATGEVLTLEDIISIKQLNIKDIKSEIRKTIKESIEKNQTLINLGYNIYERKLDDNIYEIENIDNFFYGPNDVLYIIFAYGNNRYTSELDVVTIK